MRKLFLFSLSLCLLLISIVFNFPLLAAETAQKVYLQKGITLIAEFNYQGSLSDLDSSIALCRKYRDIPTLQEGLERRAYVSFRLWKLDDAQKDLNELLQLAQKEGNKTKVCSLYISFARLQRDFVRYDSCILFGEKASELAATLQNSDLIGKSNNMLALGYYSKSMYYKANEHWLTALTYFERSKDTLSSTEVLSSLGILNSDLLNLDDAFKYLRISLGKAIRNNQFIEEGNILMYIGVTYKRSRQFDSTMVYYLKAVEIARRTNEIRLLAKAYHNISDLFKFKSQFDSALFYSKKSIEMYERMHSKSGLVFSYHNLGQMNRMIAEQLNEKEYFVKAILILEKYLPLTYEIHFQDFTLKYYDELSVCYNGIGEYRKAYNYLSSFAALEDSIRSVKTTNQISDLQAKYETEKKQAEINLLNAQKQISTIKLARRQTLNYSFASIAFLFLVSSGFIYRNFRNKRIAEKQVAVLEKQNAIENMRSKIASDVHDDMGAGLTKMGLFSEQLLQSKTVTEKEKQILEKISLQSKEVIHGMKEIIWASNPANDNLKSMLGFMRQYIDRFFDGTNIRPVVTFPHAIGEIILHPEVRRNLFLILKESLNNSLKHSGTDTIDIDFKNENEKFTFNIRDYGKGMGGSTQNDFTNGISNMQNRARQIRVLLKLTTAPGKGVQILVEGNLY
jgi:two-component system, NarL family, sensor histidine kinase UhpB